MGVILSKETLESSWDEKSLNVLDWFRTTFPFPSHKLSNCAAWGKLHVLFMLLFLFLSSNHSMIINLTKKFLNFYTC